MTNQNLRHVTLWEEFKLSDFFEMKSGKYYPKTEYAEGKTPLVSSANSNNGIMCHIDVLPVFDGNTLTIGKVGCTTFYQEKKFVASPDVTVLIPKGKFFNRNVGIFLATVINLENEKWSYGRQIRLGDCLKLVVKLPTMECGAPDWEYMEYYIKNLSKTIIPMWAKKGIKKDSITTLSDVKTWKEFKVGELFDEVRSAKATYDYGNLNDEDKIGSIAYVTRTDMKNGISCFVNGANLEVEKSNCLTIGLDTQTVFYQPNDFVCGQNINIIRSPKLNKNTALFIIPVLKKELTRFNWGGFGATITRLREASIKLPVNDLGVPDWEYMENYIINLENKYMQEAITKLV